MKEQNHVDTTITTIEMCAGYGGIGLGIERVLGERLRTIAYCELEGFAQANLISKMEAGLLDAAPLWSDLKTFPYESFHGLVDILIAGYPCQPFSAAGKRAGKDDPRHLWPWIADGIRILRPRMCFFENVEGHITLGLSTVVSDLEAMGYAVSWGIFSAAECGAPHQRKRVFILAYDKSKPSRGLPIRKETQNSKFRFSCKAGIGAWPSRPGEASTHGSRQGLWRTPSVVEEKNQNTSTQIYLQNQVGAVQKQWATPRSGKTTNENPVTWAKRQEKGDVATMPLTAQVKNHTNGKLNPRWVETLMGLPVGWVMPSCVSPVTIEPTNSDCSATELCPPPQSELF